MKHQAATTIIVYGTSWCPDCRRAKRFLDARGIAYIFIDIDQDRAALNRMKRLTHGKQVIPTIVFPDGSVLTEPSNPELAAKVGLSADVPFLG